MNSVSYTSRDTSLISLGDVVLPSLILISNFLSYNHFEGFLFGLFLFISYINDLKTSSEILTCIILGQLGT